MRSENLYQLVLIFFGTVASVMLGIFLYREIYPEYKIYQKDYVKLEEFRSTYTGQPPPAFKFGVKQIVIPREDKGPETIDRCISCHVALQFEHFSPTKIAHDLNGNILRDAEGKPVLEPNELYVWNKLDQKIADLTDEAVNRQLTEQGEKGQVKSRLKEAEELKALKTTHVDDQEYDMRKVLMMHPLMGKETRPFEFHPVDNFGCTSCHGGNGRGLVTDRAHGPVFDDTYEGEYEGPKPKFTESDPQNDPRFSKVFNSKPGNRLHFQITPLLVGSLMEAKCVQCHQPTSTAIQGVFGDVASFSTRKTKQGLLIKKAFIDDVKALKALLDIRTDIEKNGYEKTSADLEQAIQQNNLTEADREHLHNQAEFLRKLIVQQKNGPQDALNARILQSISHQIEALAGSVEMGMQIEKNFDSNDPDADQKLQMFLMEQKQKEALSGSIFDKAAALSLEEAVMLHIEEMQSPLKGIVKNQNTINGMETDIDRLTKTYQRGQELYLSQACYACHRIAGFARGGVGPELTRSGNTYPWFLKESIVWPQADLKTSTMPNMKLDHEEVEALMTFLLAQRPDTVKAVSEMKYGQNIKNWEEGQKQSWEQPIEPDKIDDVRYAMEIYATQGCAGCHRMKGFDSNVGFQVEKGKPSFDEIYREHQWFQQLFPEDTLGSKIVATIDKHADEIDAHIADNIRSGSILEQIEQNHPKSLESLYSNFKYALRAKNANYKKLADAETDPKKKQEILAKLEQWKQRVHNILMMYIQEYGLGRLIGPRLNWSGVFRSDEWLMEHFWNPSAHSPRSIMPAFPFDDTKFKALTHLLNVLARQNRDALRATWDHRGFNPQIAVQTHCAQCHGEFLQGNGPVSEWIYPIPKNLRDAVFLRNLTKERAIESITHGVKGTPMPPWGEIATDKTPKQTQPILTSSEIQQIVDWLFSDLPGEQGLPPNEKVLKWKYEPQDILKELHKEGDLQKLEPKPEKKEQPQAALFSHKGPILAFVNARWTTESRSPAAENIPEDLNVTDIFDTVTPHVPGTDAEAYYIKHKYYTDENLQQGEQLFIANCSICHGKDADGSGLRAAPMRDAKPRMLTNLDWLETRDDLRLLRSIKYGVPGTAMTPWGDLTSSWQRIQLVMYIRSLSMGKKYRDELMQTLYRSFTTTMWAVEEERAKEYSHLQETEEAYDKVRSKRLQQDLLAQQGDTAPSSQMVEEYQQELALQSKLNKAKEIDEKYTMIIQLIKQEREIFQRTGIQLVELYSNGLIFQDYLKLIPLNQPFAAGEKGSLIWQGAKEQESQALLQNITKAIDARIQSLEEQKKEWDAKPASEEKNKRLTEISTEITQHHKVKRALLSGMAEIKPLITQQERTFKNLSSPKIQK